MSHLNLHICIHTQPARAAVKEQFDILGIMRARSLPGNIFWPRNGEAHTEEILLSLIYRRLNEQCKKIPL